MKKSTLLGAIPIILLVVASFILCIICYDETKTVSTYFDGDEISAILPMVEKQKDVNRRLDAASKDSKYTFDNPYVESNPYEISPLSAVIIYNDKVKDKVEVYINNTLFTTMESSNNHIIPIYGLYEDYDNVIKLVSNNKTKEVHIKTEPSNIKYPLEIIKKSDTLDNSNIYFTVASYETWLTGWDTDGKLRFYLTENMRMDVEWLENGHFLLGTAQGQFAENFVGFFEMDYLGKIYNYYLPENGYSFEFQTLKNGNILAAGGTTPVYIKEQVVYELDPNTGKKVSDVNVSKIIKDIDQEFDSNYLGQKAIRNGFYYNEETGEMILSFRGWDSVISIDYKKKTLNWIFTSPDNELFKRDCWKDYLVTSKDNLYPLGEHSPQITKDGLIVFFNNGYLRLKGFENGGEDKVVAYKNNYSRAEAFEVENKEAKLVWSYDADKKLFSHQYGSVRIDENNNKLIDFGYVLKDEYRKDNEATLSNSEASPDNIYALIVEMDKDDNIIFEAKCEEGKYRAFKHKLYNATTSNIDLKKLNIYNNILEDKLENVTKKIDFNEATEWINTLKFTQNTFETDYPIAEDDEIKLYFVSSSGKVNSLLYKDKNNTSKNRIFNVNLVGRYALFIEINGTIYNPKKIIQF